MVGYCIGLRRERIIRYYWDNLSMVAQAGRYYSTLFKDHYGVTQ